MKELLRELVEIPWITGNEVRIREVIKEKVEFLEKALQDFEEYF